MRLVCLIPLLAAICRAAIVPLAFEPNTGQTAKEVRYLAHAPHATLWLTDQEIVLGLEQANLRMRFAGGNRAARIESENATPGRSNYFIGNDPGGWRTSIPQFGRIRYHDIYPGIDAVFYGNAGSVEYDLIVAPGADPAKIRLDFSGASQITVSDQGDLILKVAGTEIRQHKPRVYQGENPVDGNYVLLGRKRVGFRLARYDRTRPLVIDPVVTYATYLGGLGGDFGYAITSDAQGNLYVVGATTSNNFPTPGGYNHVNAGSQDAFVAKINPAASAGASLVWATYLGGTGGEIGIGVAVDRSGSVYVTGSTNSLNFPLQNPFQSATKNDFTCQQGIYGLIAAVGNGCLDAFVTKLTSTGDRLLYSSYLGGSNHDVADAIVVDGVGNAYVTGQTASRDFPLRGVLLQNTLRGTTDAFISQISADGQTLLFSSYFGGNGNDVAYGIALDSAGNIVIGGGTQSTDLPVSSGAYGRTLQGTQSGFVAQINLFQFLPTPIVYLSYLGGTPGSASVFAVASDAAGNIYAAGSTNSAGFPVTAGAYQSTLTGAPAATNFETSLFVGDAFVAKLNPSAQGSAQLLYSTYLGGSADDGAISIVVDTAGRLVVGGSTLSTDFPITPDAFQCCPGTPGKGVGFLARFDPAKSGKASLLYSTLLGGSNGDFLYSLTGDSAGTSVTAAMQSHSFDSPVTPSAYQRFFGGQITGIANDGDAYIARFDLTSVGPVITQIENAAGLAALPKGILSPGLLFTVKGAALGPVNFAGPQIDPNTGLVATKVAGVQVLVGGVPAPLTYVSSTQINAVAPYEIANQVGGTVPVQVVYNGAAGNVATAAVAATAPGILSFDDGAGQGAIVNHDGSLNSAGNPAQRGSVVSIYATGDGQTNPPGIDGRVANDALPALPRPVASVSVTIAGVTCDIGYAGTAPGGVAGFLQINLTVPTNVQAGNIPVVLTIGNQVSQAGITISLR